MMFHGNMFIYYRFMYLWSSVFRRVHKIAKSDY